jgi:hypothetical protein
MSDKSTDYNKFSSTVVETAGCNLLRLIKESVGVTYNDLVYLSPFSTQTIWHTLQELKKRNKIKTVPVPGKKAKGWRLS